ncbi:MAG: helix-turn-helix domain-containing protein [Lachnospiraceae bacterium]|nr:helix-turn-helix domain-containing protein [Lachnospiraceae bacterium]
MTIGEQLKKRRLEAKLTQKELGEKLGITQQQIAQYESGKRIPKTETIIKIAEALGFDYYDFLEVDIETVKKVTYLKKELESLNHVQKELEEYFADDTKNLDLEILQNFRKLNKSGQKEAAKRVQELTEIPRYTQEETAI